MLVAALEAGPRVARHLVAVKTRVLEDESRLFHSRPFHILVGLVHLAPHDGTIEGGVRLDGQRIHRHVGHPEGHRLPTLSAKDSAL